VETFVPNVSKEKVALFAGQHMQDFILISGDLDRVAFASACRSRKIIISPPEGVPMVYPSQSGANPQRARTRFIEVGFWRNQFPDVVPAEQR
jgi:hypothetical protein